MKQVVNTCPLIKYEVEGLQVEYELIPATELSDVQEAQRKEIYRGLKETELAIKLREDKLTQLNVNIDKLTNHADGKDYIIAIGSGVLSAMLDVFWVGEFSLERGTEWSTDKVNKFVTTVANKVTYTDANGRVIDFKGNNLQDAIAHLEKAAPLASDADSMDFGSGLQHHLRDFAHHPTPVGLLFSMLTQFTGMSYGTDTLGIFKIVKTQGVVGKTLGEKLTLGFVNWFIHMVSDMAGSSNNAGAGTGLPGPILSTLKELTALLQKSELFKNLPYNKFGGYTISEWISKAFNGTLLGTPENPVRFDLRAEIGVGYELGRQAVPVLLNECLVRSLYTIRRFFNEIHDKKITKLAQLKQINWQAVLPFTKDNRTLARMLTIATGTFTAIDVADAAIRSAINNGGFVNNPKFVVDMLLRVNFVGIGRFTVACYTDVRMGIRRGDLVRQRLYVNNQLMFLYNSRLFYHEADMWLEAVALEKSMQEMKLLEQQVASTYVDNMTSIEQDIVAIGKMVPKIDTHNPGLRRELIEQLKF
jgi:hypothetical protein